MSDSMHTVLLVDDEPEIVESLRRTLRSEGYRIVTCTSPLEALRLVASEPPDLVVLDIDMPEMSGLELMRRIRMDHPNIIRILLTGDASLDSALQAINEGEVHRYLTKPWQKDSLRATIRQALERLDELRRMANADRATRARHALLTELERAHPGIRDVQLVEGVYVLDGTSIAAKAIELMQVADLGVTAENGAISAEAPTEMVGKR